MNVFFLAVASVDIDLGAAIGSARYQIESDAANARTCANPALAAWRNVLKEAGLTGYRPDDLGPELPPDPVAVPFLGHPLNLDEGFVDDADHKILNVLGRDDLLDIQKMQVLH